MKRSITISIVLLIFSFTMGCISLRENIDFLEKETEKIQSEDVISTLCTAETAIISEITVVPDTTAINGTEYVLNINSMKFHYPTCGSGKMISEKNREYYFGVREELIQKGYSPCGNCHP